MVIYRHITTKDREYAQEKELRNRVLRLPLGLTLSGQDLRGEDEQIHLVAMDGPDEVVGCVLVAVDETSARIRQIAVEEKYRGKGIGSELLRCAEETMQEQNICKVRLHARLTARAFFERQGYRAVSRAFIEVTIPHIAMEKDLAVQANGGRRPCMHS